VLAITIDMKTGKKINEISYLSPDDIPNPSRALAQMIVDYMRRHPEIMPEKLTT
jgi:fructose 1,6-bisphosphatase